MILQPIGEFSRDFQRMSHHHYGTIMHTSTMILQPIGEFSRDFQRMSHDHGHHTFRP